MIRINVFLPRRIQFEENLKKLYIDVMAPSAYKCVESLEAGTKWVKR
jgi:hypothetical protein